MARTSKSRGNAPFQMRSGNSPNKFLGKIAKGLAGGATKLLGLGGGGGGAGAASAASMKAGGGPLFGGGAPAAPGTRPLSGVFGASPSQAMAMGLGPGGSVSPTMGAGPMRKIESPNKLQIWGKVDEQGNKILSKREQERVKEHNAHIASLGGGRGYKAAAPKRDPKTGLYSAKDQAKIDAAMSSQTRPPAHWGLPPEETASPYDKKERVSIYNQGRVVGSGSNYDYKWKVDRNRGTEASSTEKGLLGERISGGNIKKFTPGSYDPKTSNQARDIGNSPNKKVYSRKELEKAERTALDRAGHYDQPTIEERKRRGENISDSEARHILKSSLVPSPQEFQKRRSGEEPGYNYTDEDERKLTAYNSSYGMPYHGNASMTDSPNKKKEGFTPYKKGNWSSPMKYNAGLVQSQYDATSGKGTLKYGQIAPARAFGDIAQTIGSTAGALHARSYRRAKRDVKKQMKINKFVDRKERGWKDKMRYS